MALIPVSLAIPFAAVAASASAGAVAVDKRFDAPPSSRSPGHSLLVDKIRLATARFRDVNVALHEGFIAATPCVSGPSEGAMGVHFVLPPRLGDGVLNAEEPEALIYMPMPTGELRLVGVEFIALASSVQGAPQLEGHLLNYVGEPNRYGLPAFYEMHVWAWEDNPKGNFADWNTSVSCNEQPLG